MYSISFRKHHDEKKENSLCTFDHQNVILFAYTVIAHTPHASSVAPSSHRSTIFNQSANVFS